MIAKMSKIKLFYYSAAQKADLEKLQHLGLADISIPSNSSVNETSLALTRDLEKAQKSYSYLNEFLPKHRKAQHTGQIGIVTKNTEKLMTETQHAVYQITELIDQYQSKVDQIAQYQDIIAFLKPFGDVSHGDIESLKSKEIFVAIYRGKKFDIQKPSFLPQDSKKMIVVKTIKEYKKEAIYAVIEYKHHLFSPPPEWKQIYLNEDSSLALQTKIKEYTREIVALQARIVQYASLQKDIENYIALLENQLSLEQVNGLVDIREGISVLQAFVPKKQMHTITHYAKEVGCGLWVQKIEEKDEVPVLIKNNKIVSIIKPIFEFLGTVPGYKEMDISGLFFLFITLFFSMIISDAGYGLVLLLCTLYSMGKTVAGRKKIVATQVLFLVFSVSTIAWGAMTGNYFGYQAFSELPVLRDLIVPQLYTFDPVSGDYLRWLTISIGFVHLTLARTIAFFRKIAFREYLASFAEISWIVMVFLLYRLSLFLVVDSTVYPVPSYLTTALFIAIGGIVLFAEQQRGKPILKGLLSGVGGLFQTVLNVIGALSDVISYVRLYAIGLASISIETAFNQMGMDVMESGIGGLIGGVLIILAGHTLNLVMGLLAVFVHGVRLNLLEFSGHLGMEWSGRKYNPFKKKTLLSEEA